MCQVALTACQRVRKEWLAPSKMHTVAFLTNSPCIWTCWSSVRTLWQIPQQYPLCSCHPLEFRIGSSWFSIFEHLWHLILHYFVHAYLLLLWCDLPSPRCFQLLVHLSLVNCHYPRIEFTAGHSLPFSITIINPTKPDLKLFLALAITTRPIQQWWFT